MSDYERLNDESIVAQYVSSPLKRGFITKPLQEESASSAYKRHLVCNLCHVAKTNYKVRNWSEHNKA